MDAHQFQVVALLSCQEFWLTALPPTPSQRAVLHRQRPLMAVAVPAFGRRLHDQGSHWAGPIHAGKGPGPGTAGGNVCAITFQPDSRSALGFQRSQVRAVKLTRQLGPSRRWTASFHVSEMGLGESSEGRPGLFFPFPGHGRAISARLCPGGKAGRTPLVVVAIGSKSIGCSC